MFVLAIKFYTGEGNTWVRMEDDGVFSRVNENDRTLFEDFGNVAAAFTKRANHYGGIALTHAFELVVLDVQPAEHIAREETL